MRASTLALTAWAALASAQFVAQPSDSDFEHAKGFSDIQVRYKTLKTGPDGICETTPNKKSLSGFVDVAENTHIFFWFFEAREVDPDGAPLTVWINGGPGSSSMIGLFQELGPCGVGSNGSIYNNPYAWNRKTNMLFVDQPATVGLSYTVPKPGYVDPNSGDFITLPSAECPDYAKGNCATFSEINPVYTANSTLNAAQNMYRTLQGFMGAFPQYSRGDFHFTTESYGGHYGPVFNEYFEQQNAANIPGAHKISLKSVAIGNGWYDPLINYQAYYNFTVSPGNTYDYRPYNKSVESQLYNSLYGQGNCYDQLVNCRKTGRDDVCRAADNFCSNHVESVLDVVANRDEYDIRELMPDPFPYNFYEDYLNTVKVQKALGLFTNYTSGSNQVSSAFGTTGDDAREDNTIEDISKLLSQGVSVMMYFGDADYNCNWLGGQVIADLVKAPGYASAGFTNIATSDNITHGQVRQAGNFSFVRIYEAGHEVPFYQPLAALEVFERQLLGKDIATGKIAPGSTYKTDGPSQSTFREGNKTVQYKVLPSSATYNTTLNGPNPIGKEESNASPTSRRAVFLETQ